MTVLSQKSPKQGLSQFASYAAWKMPFHHEAMAVSPGQQWLQLLM